MYSGRTQQKKVGVSIASRRRQARNAGRAVQRASIGVMEQLEPRQLLSFSALINFQPTNASDFGAYFDDTGMGYRAQNGLTYGWNHTTAMTLRGATSGNSVQQYDTFAVMRTRSDGPAMWEMAVPNGTYLINLTTGDRRTGSQHVGIDVEGINVLKGMLGGNVRWISNSAVVQVTDGRLTLTQSNGVNNTPLDFLSVQQLAPSSPAGVVVKNDSRTHDLRVTWHAVDSATGYIVRMLDSSNHWKNVATVGSSTHGYTMTGLADSTSYTFSVVATNDAGSSTSSRGVSASTAIFNLYDASGYTQNIDLNNDPRSAAGLIELDRSNTNYQAFLTNHSGPVNIEYAMQVARVAAGLVAGQHFGQPRDIVIDFEPDTVAEMDSINSPATVDQTITKMLQICDALHSVWLSSSNPAIRALRIGVYGIPIFLGGNPAEQKINADYLLSHPVSINGTPRRLVDNFDFMTASIYADTTDQQAYALYAQGAMEYCNQFGDEFNKPVYAYIWPSYHEYTDTVDPVNSPIDGKYWRMILDMARQYTDSAVLWNGNAVWDPTASWWQVTQNFLAGKPASAPTAPVNVNVSTAGIVSWTNTANDTDLVYIARRVSGSNAKYVVVGTATGDMSSWSDESAPIGGTYDYQLWSANAGGTSVNVLANAKTVLAHDAFTTIPTGLTVDRGTNGQPNEYYHSDPNGDGLYGMGAGGWAHYKLYFSADATQVSFLASTPLMGYSGNLYLYVDPVMVNGQPVGANGGAPTVIEFRQTGDDWLGLRSFAQSFDIRTIGAGMHDIYLASGSTDTAANIMTMQFGSDTSMGPAQPTELLATSHGSTVHLRWLNWASNETSYEIQASTDGITFKNVAEIDSSDSRYVDGTGHVFNYDWTLPDDSTYTFQVRAVRSKNTTAGTGSPTNYSISARSNQDAASRTVREGVIQAEDYDEPSLEWLNAHIDSATGGNVADSQNVLLRTADGVIVRYRGVDFGSGSNSITFRLGTADYYVGKTIEIWIDGDGQNRFNQPANDGGIRIGTLTTDATGGISVFKFDSAAISMLDGSLVSGVHDVYFKMIDATHSRTDGSSVAVIDSFSVGYDPNMRSVVANTYQPSSWQQSSSSSNRANSGTFSDAKYIGADSDDAPDLLDTMANV